VKDIRVKITVRNNLILDAIEAAGFATVAEFCRQHGLTYESVSCLIGMRRSPMKSVKVANTDARLEVWSKPAQDVADALSVAPETLFSEDQLAMQPLKKSTTELAMAMGDAGRWLGGSSGIDTLLPDQRLMLKQARDTLMYAISTLTPREQLVLSMRFGLHDGIEHGFLSIGKSFNVTRECIRQIESRALRKLRHPTKALPMRDAYQDVSRVNLPGVPR
jgi:hypothetical protein